MPTDADGKDGDLCLYTDGEDVWDVYYKVSGKWTRLGSIKGADGKGGAVEEEGVEVDVSPEAAATIDISDLSVGTHLIWAELDKSLTENTGVASGQKATYNGGKLEVKVGDGLTCELIKHAEKSGEDKNVYYGFLIKKSDEDTTATLSTDKDTVKAKITFEDYAPGTLTAGGASVIMPINEYQAANIITIPISVEPDTYTITIETEHSMLDMMSKFLIGSSATTINHKSSIDVTVSGSYITGDDTCYLIQGQFGDKNTIVPAIVTMTVKDA